MTTSTGTAPVITERPSPTPSQSAQGGGNHSEYLAEITPKTRFSKSNSEDLRLAPPKTRFSPQHLPLALPKTRFPHSEFPHSPILNSPHRPNPFIVHRSTFIVPSPPAITAVPPTPWQPLATAAPPNANSITTEIPTPYTRPLRPHHLRYAPCIYRDEAVHEPSQPRSPPLNSSRKY